MNLLGLPNNKIEDAKILEKLNLIDKTLSKEVLTNHINISLLEGFAGASLFKICLGEYLNDDSKVIEGINILISITNDLKNRSNSSSFSSGLAGICWLINFAHKKNYINKLEIQFLDKIDKYLYNCALELINNKNIDFLSGAAGIAFYFSKRENNDENISRYNKISDYIFNQAINDNAYIKWYEAADGKNLNSIDFGIAHGLCGIISVLAIKSKEVRKDNLKILQIKKGIDYLLQFKLPNKFANSYSNGIFSNGAPINNSPLRWCHGDLGTALTLFRIWDITKENSYYEKGELILLKTLQRTNLEIEGINDACICHGTSGVSLIYKRAFELTNRYEFYNAYKYWQFKTIKMGNILNNNYTYQFSKGIKKGFTFNFGVLNGISGVGLSLIPISYKSDWDEILLIR